MGWKEGLLLELQKSERNKKEKCHEIQHKRLLSHHLVYN